MSPRRGAGLGLLGAVFAIGLPTSCIAWLVRSGGATDRHVSRREDRPKVLVVVLGCLAAGLGVLALLGAPALLVAVCLVISRSWKVSCTRRWRRVRRRRVVVLGVWAVLAVVPVVPVVLVCWARVVRGDHTVGQVVAGAGLVRR